MMKDVERGKQVANSESDRRKREFEQVLNTIVFMQAWVSLIRGRWKEMFMYDKVAYKQPAVAIRMCWTVSEKWQL